MDAFISSQFNYCPIIWMCYSRCICTQKLYSGIHKRALGIVYIKTIFLKSLDWLVIHHRNIQLLAIEIYKALNNVSSLLMAELFKMKESNYDLRTADSLVSNKPISTTYGMVAILIWSQTFRNKSQQKLNVTKC